MELRNLIGYLVGWYFEWIFELHEGFACYGWEYFEMEYFENEPYLGLTHFGYLVGIA